MLLQSGSKYKSLEPIQPAIELPDLVILSGLNGGGKTQLLTAIAQDKITLTEGVKAVKPVKLVDHNTLAPNNGAAFPREVLRPEIEALINEQKKLKPQESQSTRQPV